MKFNSLFLIAVVLLLFSVQYSQAAAFEFEKQTINDVVAQELSIPAKYNLTIKNTNIYNDYFKVYSVLDIKVSPLESFLINSSQQNSIIIEISPLESLKEKGLHRVQYYIKGDKAGALLDTVIFDIVQVKDILNISSQTELSREDTAFLLSISNKKNIDLGEVIVTIESPFFSSTKNITIKPLSSENLRFDLNPEQMKTSKAGNYNLNVKFLLNNEYTYIIEKNIEIKEFTSITTSEKSDINYFGITKTITKKNEGNSPRFVTIEVKKSSFERAFSTFNVVSTYEKLSEDGFILVGWQRQIESGESFTIDVTTDYTILVVIIAMLIASAVSIYLINRPRIILRKRTIYVKTKGNEFAVKVVLFAKNIGKEAKDVVLRDRLPHIAKLHERFGSVKPDKFDKNTLEWQFNFIVPGEERVASYVFYSEVLPVGRMELPQAVLTYTDEKEKKKIVYSNRVFVVR